MKGRDFQKRKCPEKIIQTAIVKMLRSRGWFVVNMHGNMYQQGVPDLYATHISHGARWIEVKLPEMKGSKFTKAQLECFPQYIANGAGIWVLTAATFEEYEKLKEPCNWHHYLGIMKWRG